jgi:hypothetical protein
VRTARPRCLVPVRYYGKPGRAEDPSPRCGRPRRHRGRHLSEWTWRRELDRRAHWARELRKLRRQERLAQRPLVPCPSEAAYRRHLRHHEVPCEEDYAEMIRVNQRRRAARRQAA